MQVNATMKILFRVDYDGLKKLFYGKLYIQVKNYLNNVFHFLSNQCGTDSRMNLECWCSLREYYIR